MAKTDPVLSGRAGDLMIGFAPGAIIVQTPGSSASDRLTISFEGAQSASPSGDGLEKSHSNYLIGNDPASWRTHVPNYRQVRYRGLYQGVDAVFYGNGPQLEHDFVVEPGADYKQIRMRFSGATELSSSEDGSLRITFGPQVAGTSSSPQTITLSNIGTGQLVNPQMSISGPGPVSFTLTTTCGLTLDIGASCTASIVFSPAATGTINATLTVFANGYISSPVTLTGSAPQIPFSIGKQPSGSTTATVAAGSSASYALQVAPAGGYSGTVTLSCTGVPANGSCGFSPGSLALANGTPSSFTLVIATQASQSASLLPMIRSGAPLLCALMLLPFGACRKWRAVLCAISLSLLAAALLLISGCSGGSSGPGSGSQPKTVAKGTYTISVIANDGKASQTQSVTLIVN